MSKFKVGDKVALNNSPNVLFGQVEGDVCEVFGGYYIKMEENYYAIMPEDELVLYNEPTLSDDEIFNMLKPKMKKGGAYIYCGYYYELNSTKAIALAYRSGYLRAKKGRPFKIGGEKE